MDEALQLVQKLIDLKENDPDDYVILDIDHDGIAFFQAAKMSPDGYRVELATPDGPEKPFDGNRLWYKNNVPTVETLRTMLSAIQFGIIPDDFEELKL